MRPVKALEKAAKAPKTKTVTPAVKRSHHAKFQKLLLSQPVPASALVGAHMADVITQNLTFACAVKSASASGVGISIDGQIVRLSQDADTWTGNISLDVAENVVIKFRVKGLNSTEWQVDIAINCQKPLPIVSQKGVIGQPNGAGFDSIVKIKPNLCMNNNNN